jgi:hypothetical protein
MQPHTPVIPGMEMLELVMGKNQPEYAPLPVLRTAKGQVLMRFTLTNAEREAIENGADVYVSLLTFGGPMTPIMIGVAKPDEDLTENNMNIAKMFGIEV